MGHPMQSKHTSSTKAQGSVKAVPEKMPISRTHPVQAKQQVEKGNEATRKTRPQPKKDSIGQECASDW